MDPRAIYTWRAIYADGNILNQYNGDGSKNSYRDIKRGGLRQFCLLDQHGKTVLVVHLGGDKRLIWRMRVALKIYSGEETRVHLVGWQELRNGVNVQLLCALFPDGHVEVVDGFHEGTKWFYKVRFNREEQP